MRPPDFQGRAGVRAWRQPLSSDRVVRRAVVAAYIIHAPDLNPDWESYWLGLMHLRGYYDQDQPPIIRREGATHEVGLYALHPAQKLWHLIDAWRSQVTVIRPANYMGQFRAVNDATAMARVEKTVGEIVQGVLDPDTDFSPLAVEAWKARYGNHCFNEPTTPEGDC